MKINVRWDREARAQLKEAYSYIRRDSPSNAEKVRKKIMATANSLPAHPKKYPADKYKIENDGTYRSFIVYHYRISYMITDSEIIILRVRHTSMEPLEY